MEKDICETALADALYGGDLSITIFDSYILLKIIFIYFLHPLLCNAKLVWVMVLLKLFQSLSLKQLNASGEVGGGGQGKEIPH